MTLRQWAGVAVVGTLTSAGALALAQEPKPVTQLKVPLTSSAGTPAGTVTFKQQGNAVLVKVSLENIPAGEHGVHIHQNPVCEGPDFKTAGGHFNPDSKQHGFQNASGHHAGDTPSNVKVSENGKGSASWKLTAVTLAPGAPNSLFANGGTSIVVHEKADDMKTDPSGNSGNRIACGVIKP